MSQPWIGPAFSEPEHFGAALRFYIGGDTREFALIDDYQGDGPWIVMKHPDGQWVTCRKASPSEVESIHRAYIERNP